MKLGRTRLIAIGGALLVLVVAAVAWLFVLSPRMSQASEISAEAVQMQTANLSLRNQYNQSLDLAMKVPDAAAKAQKLFATMPQSAELPSVIDQLTKAASDAGIKADSIQTINATIPMPIDASGGTGSNVSGIQLAQMELTITANAKPPQALKFLDNLQSLDRALLLTSSALQRSASDNGASQDAQVTGSMFVLNSKLPDLVAQVQKLLAAAGQNPAGGTPATPAPASAAPSAAPPPSQPAG